MALSSALYAAVTGLSALGTGMQTISNNIANVNTVGFKAGRTNYEDLISQNYFSGGQVNQRGCGVKVSSIQSMFTQGAFMSSAQDTDMAIAGEGFFSVRNNVTNAVQYTRAGVFTLNKDGYMQDPSGNILQGWQMSIPKPGQDPVRIGAPMDIKITVLNAPPVKTSQIKIVTNLNADDKTAYKYKQDQLAVDYATAKAKIDAEAARLTSARAVWYPEPAGPDYPAKPSTDPIPSPTGTTLAESSKPEFDQFFMDAFKTTFGVDGTGYSNLITNMRVILDADGPVSPAARAQGWMTQTDYNALVTQATGQMESLAAAQGEAAYTRAYNEKYPLYYKELSGSVQEQWQIEGDGFAAAWNAQNNPPIDTNNDIHAEARVIYDSLGSEHKLMIYYQKNPVMENVWDYIITCDPTEDARKDGNLALLFSETASFSGLIQKGKITFSGDGDDRHGGVIKDIEAQNLNLGLSKMSVIQKPDTKSAESQLTQTAAIGGYYNGSPSIDPTALKNSGIMYEATSRTYTITWGSTQARLNAWTTRYASWCSTQVPVRDPEGPDSITRAQNITDYEAAMAAAGTPDPMPTANDWSNLVPGNPPTSGFTVVDSLGNISYIPINDVNYAGPYQFGSGLTITFDQDMLPLSFGTPGVDKIKVSTSSEQTAWTDLKPKDMQDGLFGFDVAFVQSASMALHPPYPSGMPTLSQHISFDMGAKYNGSNPKWVLDEMSTTQYAGETSTAFSGQDGFPAGSLQRVSIGEDGVVTGIYSNGRHQALYQIGLTRFLNPWGLSKEGDNLFSETRYSGSGALNPPGYGGTGTILANFLEQSNVDLAEEIVNMIVTQRGFQANSKTVTTTDTMLAEVIEMKR